MTALMLACANEKEAVAALLMEATQKAGALDVQVNVVWSVWEGLGRWRGPNRPVVKLCSPYPRLLSFLMLGVDSCFYDKS